MQLLAHSAYTGARTDGKLSVAMVTVSVVNQKGGVGKTTTTINLAYALALQGLRVLAVDLDPQASLTIYAGLDVQELEGRRKTLYYSLVEDEPIEQLITETEHFDVIPNSIRLSTGEAELVASPLTGPHLLKGLLASLRARYDYILIDCPPTLTLLTVNALAAADEVLIPVKTDILSLMGITLLLDSIEKTRRRANPDLKILGILPTMHNARYTHDQEALEELHHLGEHGIRVFEPISRSTAFDQAPAEFRSTLELDPSNPGARGYYKLAEAIVSGNVHIHDQ